MFILLCDYIYDILIPLVHSKISVFFSNKGIFIDVLRIITHSIYLSREREKKKERGRERKKERFVWVGAIVCVCVYVCLCMSAKMEEKRGERNWEKLRGREIESERNIVL